MGWIEFRTWIKIRNRQIEAERDAVDSWDRADANSFWAEQRASRRQQRGW
jgi:hypothetical protein